MILNQFGFHGNTVITHFDGFIEKKETYGVTGDVRKIDRATFLHQLLSKRAGIEWTSCKGSYKTLNRYFASPPRYVVLSRYKCDMKNIIYHSGLTSGTSCRSLHKVNFFLRWINWFPEQVWCFAMKLERNELQCFFTRTFNLLFITSSTGPELKVSTCRSP